MDVSVRHRVRHGKPEEEVPREVLGHDHDLIVMGCRNQPGRGFTWFGPTAESVIAQARVPFVLLVARAGDRRLPSKPDSER
jgi:nucleotide-binding universal stress UspA family protein